MFSSASTHVSYQPSGDAGVASEIGSGGTSNHMRSKDKEAPVDTSGLADIAGSPEAAQGSAGKNTGGAEALTQKPGADGGNESHSRKQLRNQRKWE